MCPSCQVRSLGVILNFSPTPALTASGGQVLSTLLLNRKASFLTYLLKESADCSPAFRLTLEESYVKIRVLRFPYPALHKECPGLPGGAVDKNSPASVGDTGSIPGPGRFHMLQSNEAHGPQRLSLSSRACGLPTTEPVCCNSWSPWTLEPVLRKRSHRTEKPTHCNEEQPLLAATRESPGKATKTQCSQK